MTKEVKCPFDGNIMRKANLKQNVNGVHFESEGYRCPKCGFSVFTIEQSEKAHQKYLRLKTQYGEHRKTLVAR